MNNSSYKNTNKSTKHDNKSSEDFTSKNNVSDNNLSSIDDELMARDSRARN